MTNIRTTPPYEVLTGGVLKVSSGNDIHLYSPAYWQEVTIDTRRLDSWKLPAKRLRCLT
jgi:hypothetical protein